MRLGIEWDYIKTKYANYGTPIPGSGGVTLCRQKWQYECLQIRRMVFLLENRYTKERGGSPPLVNHVHKLTEN